jgi:hypothetical protein
MRQTFRRTLANYLYTNDKRRFRIVKPDAARALQ